MAGVSSYAGRFCGPEGICGPKFPQYEPAGVFDGPAFEWVTEDAVRDAVALEAVRRFAEEYGRMPTQESWAAAGMSPCERTVRKRFGNFRAAMEEAGVQPRAPVACSERRVLTGPQRGDSEMGGSYPPDSVR